METFADLGGSSRELSSDVENVRSSEGEKLVLEQNLFIEQMLPSVTMRSLTEIEMENYRKPYTTPGDDRQPTLTFPREVPLNGKPSDVATAMDDYAN